MTPAARNGPTLNALSFGITDDLVAHADRRECVEFSELSAERKRDVEGRDYLGAMPDWAATDPVPLNRLARHFEPLFEAVSDSAYNALRELLGATIESAEQFVMLDSSRRTRLYHRVTVQPHPLDVDWEQTQPGLEGVDLSDSLATRKALRRQHGTVLALSDEYADSTELLRLTHLSMYPMVTSRFIEAWPTIAFDYGATRLVDGPYFLEVVTGPINYRWTTSPN